MFDFVKIEQYQMVVCIIMSNFILMVTVTINRMISIMYMLKSVLNCMLIKCYF